MPALTIKQSSWRRNVVSVTVKAERIEMIRGISQAGMWDTFCGGLR